MTKSRRIRQNKKRTRKSFRNFMKGSRKMVMNPLKNNRFTRKMFGGQEEILKGNKFAPPAFVVTLNRKDDGTYTVPDNGIAFVNDPFTSNDFKSGYLETKNATIINGTTSDSGKYVADLTGQTYIENLHPSDRGILFPPPSTTVPPPSTTNNSDIYDDIYELQIGDELQTRADNKLPTPPGVNPPGVNPPDFIPASSDHISSRRTAKKRTTGIPFARGKAPFTYEK